MDSNFVKRILQSSIKSFVSLEHSFIFPLMEVVTSVESPSTMRFLIPNADVVCNPYKAASHSANNGEHDILCFNISTMTSPFAFLIIIPNAT